MDLAEPKRRSTLSERVRRFKAELPHLPRALGLIWDASRGWTLGWAALLLIQGTLPVVSVYLTRAVVNRLVEAIRTRGAWETLQPVLVAAMALGAVMIVAELLRTVSTWVRTTQTELVQDHIAALIHEKSLAADLAFYDSPDFYDHLYRARRDAGHRPLALLESLGSLAQHGVTLFAMGAVLIPFGWWLVPALILSTAPALWVVTRHSTQQHRWRMQRTAIERRLRYFDWAISDSGPAVEVRLLDLGPYFRRQYQDLRQLLHRERTRLATRQSLGRLGAGVLGLAVNGAAMAWMGWKTIQGQMSLGDLAMFYQAFNQGQSLSRSLLDNVGMLYANMLFLGNLFEFLEMKPQVVDPPNPVPAPTKLREGIRFRDVTFRYPGSERPALDSFSLTIPPGQLVAVVGSNGAGKSTLIKLLCRFYDPQQGRIELGGTDLRDMTLASVRRLITVLFQEPVRYQATVRENIELGDLAMREPRGGGAEEAARHAGLDPILARLPEGFESQLGRWFAKGTELSVGEWQRLALARAFFRRAPILVLDEPTSAMDPWAEHDWVRRFRKLAAGRISIIITHRLTTAAHADVIHVMSEGRIVESGAHLELLDRRGYYARAWAAQAERTDGTPAVPSVLS